MDPYKRIAEAKQNEKDLLQEVSKMLKAAANNHDESWSWAFRRVWKKYFAELLEFHMRPFDAKTLNAYFTLEAIQDMKLILQGKKM